jgi:hypothetical protein
MAGRVLRISVPTVGSKLTVQSSPRFGRGLRAFDKVASLPFFAFTDLGPLLVVLDHSRRLFRHLTPPFFKRQFHKSSTVFQRKASVYSFGIRFGHGYRYSNQIV